MTRYTFQRRNGASFTIEIAIDEKVVAEEMARRLARSGKLNGTAMGGGVVVTVVEEKAN